MAALRHAAELACQGVLQTLMLCHAGVPLLSAPEQAPQLTMCAASTCGGDGTQQAAEVQGKLGVSRCFCAPPENFCKHVANGLERKASEELLYRIWRLISVIKVQRKGF